MHSTSSRENTPSAATLFMAKAQSFRQAVIVQLESAHQQAGDVGANLHMELAHRLAMQHGVIADDFVDLQPLHAAALGHFRISSSVMEPTSSWRVNQHGHISRPGFAFRVARRAN